MTEEKLWLIEELFTGFFNEEADKINKDFEDLICIVYVYPPVKETKFRDACLGLDVVLHKTDFDATDNLCLEIHIAEQKKLLKVNVKIGWGYPSEEIPERMFKAYKEVTEETLAEIKEKLPDWVSKFRQTIRDNPRGK